LSDPPPSDWRDGLAHHQAGRLDEAEAVYRAVLQHEPGHADCLHLLGALALQRGRAAEAVETIGRAIALAPERAHYHENLGRAWLALGRLDEAEAALRAATALNPAAAGAHRQLGTVLQQRGRLAEAEASCRAAVDLSPHDAGAQAALANVLQALNRLDDAADAYARAIALQPDLAEAHCNRALLLLKLARQREAGEACERALALRPDYASARHRLLMTAVYRDDLDNDAFGALHRRVAAALAPAEPIPAPPAPPRADRRLRIGYLTSDLTAHHPVANNLGPLLRHHDRARFAVHLYTDVARSDEATAAFRAGADGWRDLTGASDAEAAQQIRADGIDILACVAGRFDANRAFIARQRAAPVQISLFDAATSGLAEMDYFVADRRLLPGASTEYFTERPLRLPWLYVAPPPTDLPALGATAGAAPMFGCFGNPAKITPSVLACWGAILAALPDSRLQLKFMDYYASPRLRAQIGEPLLRAGAKPAQIEFVTVPEARAAFLARHNIIDVALDTFPFSGSTTSFQALAMGTPIVTWPQDRYMSRWTAAMLRAVGLPELIAASAQDYVAIACRVAGERAAWRQQRAAVRARLLASPLCDGVRWTRRLERLYRAAWERHRRAAA
jgi:predicted O-linked N-acetylglucosamine transferase (SPINDLY family)